MRNFSVLVLLIWVASCNVKQEPIVVSAEELHGAVDKVTDIMVHDIFSPPVASRIYAYPNIAAFEIMVLNNEKYNSLSGQVRELNPIPKPEAGKEINYPLAALIAHMDVSRRLIFTEEKIVV
ncbi:MAG: phosphatidic acid phosphatase, partial [Eudoraea sp.]|nr:phosphatidic acid phosphatase [Eudoraea sp.]